MSISYKKVVGILLSYIVWQSPFLKVVLNLFTFSVTLDTVDLSPPHCHLFPIWLYVPCSFLLLSWYLFPFFGLSIFKYSILSLLAYHPFLKWTAPEFTCIFSWSHLTSKKYYNNLHITQELLFSHPFFVPLCYIFYLYMRYTLQNSMFLFLL